MDIHFLPGVTVGQSPLAPKTTGPEQPTEGTFQQVLGRVVPKSDKVTDAAKQFEALIMGQVLKAAREASDGGWLGTGDDQTGELALEMAEQGFAQALASRGGMGIAKMVAPTLRRDEAKAASSGLSTQGLPVQPSKDSGH
jgi:Rod binding domain-containing protein